MSPLELICNVLSGIGALLVVLVLLGVVHAHWIAILGVVLILGFAGLNLLVLRRSARNRP